MKITTLVLALIFLSEPDQAWSIGHQRKGGRLNKTGRHHAKKFGILGQDGLNKMMDKMFNGYTERMHDAVNSTIRKFRTDLSKGVSQYCATNKVESEQCTGPQMPTNSTEKTLSYLADGEHPTLFVAPKVLHDAWKLLGVDSRSKVIKKGREFVEFLKERFGVDVSSLTDEELYQGQPVDVGHFTFTGYIIKANLRSVTQTTPQRCVTYYRNTSITDVGFLVVAKRSMASKGQWQGRIPKGSALYMINTYFSNEESGLEKGPTTIEGRAIQPWFVKDRFVILEMDVYSPKYGHGVMHGVEIQSTSYVVVKTMRFPDSM